MNCPNCQNKLSKFSDAGEGIWQCRRCLARWFIVQTHKPERDIITREAAYAAFVAGELTREKLEEALR
jgi:ribosomal protein L37AE/L43A